MTKNGLRRPCYCRAHKCGGRERDYRTVDKHAQKDDADRPLYPVADVDSDQQEHIDPEHLPPLPIQDPPYAEVAMEDIVSHVESLPHCHEPVYETVHIVAL